MFKIDTTGTEIVIGLTNLSLTGPTGPVGPYGSGVITVNQYDIQPKPPYSAIQGIAVPTQGPFEFTTPDNTVFLNNELRPSTGLKMKLEIIPEHVKTCIMKKTSSDDCVNIINNDDGLVCVQTIFSSETIKKSDELMMSKLKKEDVTSGVNSNIKFLNGLTSLPNKVSLFI